MGMAMPKTILVADDNREHLSLFEQALTGRGYQVLRAMDGREALELAQAKRPDLIVLDVQMPHMYGDMVYMSLKAHDSPLRQTPIIIVTGLWSEEEIRSHHEKNMFSKPVPMEPFLAKVDELIGRPA